MNTYGHTACPKCQVINAMYRPIEQCRKMVTWDGVTCANCQHDYFHSSVYKKPKLHKRIAIKKPSEAKQVKQSGQY